MAQTSLLSSQTMSSIQYRLYEDRDSENLIKLEDEAPQQAFFRTIHRESYDFRCKLFKEHIIIVGEDSNESSNHPKVVAGICAGIKSITMQGQKVKAAIMFDLRVSSKYQRKGIGESICHRLEEECSKRGVEFIYLSVNANNDRAIFLYKKLGYEIFSNRKYDVIRLKAQNDMIFNLKKKIRIGDNDQTIEFVSLEKEESIKHYSQVYSIQDLAPSSFEDWSDLIHQPSYKGTYVVRTSDKKNQVGISMSQFPYSGYMGIPKVLFPTSFYNSLAFPAIIISLIFFGLLGPWQNLQSLILSLNLGGFLTWIMTFFSFVVGFTLIVYLFLYIRGIFLTFAGFENRGRLIGPFANLENQALKKPMFEFLMYQMNRRALNEQIASVVYNRDINDRFFGNIVEKPGNLPEKRFMGKYLKTAGDKSIREYRPTEDIFFDFRDV